MSLRELWLKMETDGKIHLQTHDEFFETLLNERPTDVLAA